jgi:hypothetical protein
MSNQKHFGPFTGGQLAAIICAAILAPTALYAVTYTYVAIGYPANGKIAAVDSASRLYVYDPVAGYANSPANLIEISGETNTSTTTTVYTVPAGYAFILKSANMSFFNGTSGSDNWTYFYDGTSDTWVTGFDDPNTVGAHYSTLGSGYYFHSGDIVTYYSTVNTEYSLEGYLVPANAVPAVEAPQQIKVGTSKKK